MAAIDDAWTRIFDVSNPRKSYAGHTLYRVASKVFPKDFPEAVTEVVVWKRYSDFKKLHRELLHIYNQQKHSTSFPTFPKAKFFGRFDEGVIEDRRQHARELLKFVGNVSSLFTSAPFVKFFEGGIPKSPSSRTPSLSGSDCTPEVEPENSAVPTPKEEKKAEDKDLLEVGGVWLCKQPSMVEGLDMAGTGEDQAGDNRRPETPDTDLQGTALEVPIEVQTMITRTTDTDMAEGDLNSGIPAEEDMADSDSCGSDDTGSSASEPTPQWLQRAISLCSEGEDIEVLAAAADEDELFGELEYPKAFSDVEEDDLGSPLHLSYKIHDSSSENFADISQDDLDNSILSNGSDEALHKDGKSGSQQSQTKISSEEKFQGQTKLTKNNSRNGHSEDTELSVMNRPDTIPPSKSDTDLNSYSKDAHSSLESDIVSTPPEEKSCVLTTHDIAEMTSNGESDYLFVAAHTIRKALDCEVNGRYEEAFNLYRACVSLLLSGVQGEQDVKRRDAVRRKTAQYLLKAEALYTAYVHDLQKSEASSDQDQDKPNHVVTEGPSHTHMTSPQGAHKYKSITLSNLKVIGITGKVMLVENPDISETFIMKVGLE